MKPVREIRKLAISGPTKQLGVWSSIRLENLADRVPGIIAVINVKTAEYLYVNRALKKLLGYEQTEFVSGGLEFATKLIHPDDVAEVMSQNNQALEAANAAPATSDDQEPIANFEYRMRHKNGKWVWLRTDGSVYSRDSQGKVECILNISLDITKQKMLENRLLEQSRLMESEGQRALKASQERLSMALEASQLGTWEWKIDENKLMWSPKLKILFGMKPNQKITFKNYIKRLHPEDKDALQATINDSMKTGKPYEIEHRVVWPDGSVHWLIGMGKAYLVNGHAVRMVGTSADIDERKASELALYESQLRYKTLTESTVVGIFVPHRDGRIVEANDAYLKIIGYTRNDLTSGKLRWDDKTPPEYQALDDRKHQELDKYNETTPWEKEYIKKDGSRIWVMISAVKFPHDNDTALAIAIDISERKKVEAKSVKLAHERRQLKALNKAKDDFISIASHQLRTPSTGVKQYLAMLLDGMAGEMSEPQTKMVKTAYNSNERQLLIIDDLLKTAHIDAGKVRLKKSTFDLVRLTKQIVNEQQERFIQYNQNLEFYSTKQQLIVRADVRLLRMVIENIIDNARKYSPKKSTVTVIIRTERERVALIDIKDHGVGIATKDQKKLFQKFSRIYNERSATVSGTGLGLYWAKKIVDLHDGDISLRSHLNSGSTFTISLPL